jgi:hypothetical protein
MSSTFKTPKAAPTMTVERAREIIEFISRKFINDIPRSCFALNMELARSVTSPTKKLIEWLNVIANVLKNPDGKMVMDDKKAEIIEFVIAG